MHENDPLWRLRHALAGVGLALLASVFIAAFAGAFLGDLFGDSYGLRVTFYAGLLLYVVVGAGMLFAKVARHETRPVSAGRLALWLASLWLWPGLWWVARGRAGDATAQPQAQMPDKMPDKTRTQTQDLADGGRKPPPGDG